MKIHQVFIVVSLVCGCNFSKGMNFKEELGSLKNRFEIAAKEIHKTVNPMIGVTSTENRIYALAAREFKNIRKEDGCSRKADAKYFEVEECIAKTIKEYPSKCAKKNEWLCKYVKHNEIIEDKMKEFMGIMKQQTTENYKSWLSFFWGKLQDFKLDFTGDKNDMPKDPDFYSFKNIEDCYKNADLFLFVAKLRAAKFSSEIY